MLIHNLIQKMTLDQKVGQLITFESFGMRLHRADYDKIERLQCGGIRLTPHIHDAIPYEKRFDKGAANLQRLAYHCPPEQYAEMVHRLQEIAKSRSLGIPLHISIDQEGDFSCDYARGGVNLLPSAMGLTATNDPELVFEAYKAVGRQLRSIGATMVHSPVLDVNSNPKNPEICTRSFSDDPEWAARFALQCMKGFMAAGVMPTAKHFPGRGASGVDLHHDHDVDKRSLADYEKGELIPYVRLIAAGLPAIMTSHQICPAFGGEEKPATVSKSIYRYIREVLKFEGVITTDAMGMKGVLALYGGFGTACAEAFAAGADLILAKCHPAIENEVFSTMKRYVEEGKVSLADLDKKVERVLAMKYRQGLFGEYFSPSEAGGVLLDETVKTPIRRAAEKSVLVIRDEENLLPLTSDKKVLVVEPFYREWQGKGFDAFYHPAMLSLCMERFSRNIFLFEHDIQITPAEEADLLQQADAYDVIVVNTFYWRGCGTNTDAVKKLIARGKKVLVVATAPFENVCAPEIKSLIVSWGQVPESQRTVSELLFGRRLPQGTWPLKVNKIRGIA